MKFTTFALSAFACFGAASAHGWYNNSVITTEITVTDYTTFCPAPTVVTVTTCSNHNCGPKTITVFEETTITVTGECLVSTVITPGAPSETQRTHEITSITTDMTVTGFTTYCPSHTTLTITTCSDHRCVPQVITASSETTFTFTGECVISTTIAPVERTVTITKTEVYPKGTTVTGFTTYCSESTVFTISTCKDQVCLPTTCTASDKSTFTFTDECVIPSSVSSEFTYTSTEVVIITEATVTDYTTFCSESTIFTISTCENNVCRPTICTASEETTFTFPGRCVVPSISTPGVVKTESVITTEATVTGYTTYCPESTTFTISTCNEEECAPTVISVSEATTLSFSETCVVTTLVTSSFVYTETEVFSTVETVVETVTGYTTFCPSPTVFTISTCNNHGCKPSVVSVTDATTLSFSHPVLVSTTYSTAAVVTGIAVTTTNTAVTQVESIATTKVTVPGYTTFCPGSTVLTFTTCSGEICSVAIISVSEATTLSFNQPVVVSSPYTTAVPTTTYAISTVSTLLTMSASSSTTPPAVTTAEGIAARVTVGGAGLIGLIAFLA